MLRYRMRMIVGFLSFRRDGWDSDFAPAAALDAAVGVEKGRGAGGWGAEDTRLSA